MRHNPYLMRFRQLEAKPNTDASMHMFTARRPLCQKYSFAIPDSEAIRILVSLSPIVELGAGTGYWAHLIRKYGGKIEAYDSREGKYGFKKPHFPVRDGNETVLEKYSPEWSLFLCWPCFDSPFANNALKAFQGDRVCYVGETKHGCTGDALFHDRLDQCWQVETHHWIPQWPGIHDQLFVYRRKG